MSDTVISTTEEPQIRHAGRAHIRGKIRRVWRPRYLELWDNALVRYYELPATADIAMPQDTDTSHINMISKYTLAIYHARILDVTTLRDMHVGLPRGNFGFLFRGQRLMHLELSNTSVMACQEIVKEQRDFLCAVSTLEEAQMWVVALQWAALQNATPVVEPWWKPEGGTLESSWVHPDTPSVQSLDNADTSFTSDTESTQKLWRPKQPPPPEQPVIGKVVVTKVVQYRTVRVGTWQWEVAYEIHGMLLRNRHVELWTMLRTANDFQNLVSDLCQELTWIDPAQLGPIRQLPRLAIRPTTLQLQASISVVDSILRSLVMDASMVNATCMKVFLGLSQRPSSTITEFPWRYWTVHNGKTIQTRTTKTLPNHVSTDQYVKQWLQQRDVQQSRIDTCAASLLQRPLAAFGGMGLSTVAIPTMARLWHQYMPVLTLRLDVLVVSLAGAAYVGRLYPFLEQQRPKPPSHLARSKQRPTDAKDIPRIPRSESHDSEVMVKDEIEEVLSTTSVVVEDEESDGELTDGEEEVPDNEGLLSSPLPEYPSNDGFSCWSEPKCDIFHVRGANYLNDKIKIPSGPAPLTCRGVDFWMTDNPPRHIARHPAVLGGQLGEEDTFLVNFLLPFGNFVAYFSIPPLNKFPKKLRNVWTKFLKGDQQYRDARLKLLPVVVEGPWIVKAAVGPGKSPALLGKVIPLQYFFRDPDRYQKGVYEVDVIITASTIAKGILSVVKGHTKAVTIAFALIIEAAEEADLPETVLCHFQAHSVHLEDCPILPECNLDEIQP